MYAAKNGVDKENYPPTYPSEMYTKLNLKKQSSYKSSGSISTLSNSAKITEIDLNSFKPESLKIESRVNEK